MDVKGSGHGPSEVLLQHLLEGTEKSQWKSVRLAGATDHIHTRYYHLNQSLQYICIMLSITITRTSVLFISQSTSVCPYPSRCHNSLQVYILHANDCHHMHSSIYLHGPSSSKVHLCWSKCSVKSQMMGLILQWRPNVMTLLMAVLSLLNCLYKIGQSSSHHPVTICVLVLCPITSLRSVTSKDSCKIPSCFHMVLQGIYSCQYHCDVVWTDTTQLPKCYIYLHYFWCHLGTSHLSG